MPAPARRARDGAHGLHDAHGRAGAAAACARAGLVLLRPHRHWPGDVARLFLFRPAGGVLHARVSDAVDRLAARAVGVPRAVPARRGGKPSAESYRLCYSRTDAACVLEFIVNAMLSYLRSAEKLAEKMKTVYTNMARSLIKSVCKTLVNEMCRKSAMANPTSTT